MTLSNHWTEHNDYPQSDWRDEVAVGATLLGYWAWVKEQKQWDYEEEKEQGKPRTCYTCRYFRSTGTVTMCNLCQGHSH